MKKKYASKRLMLMASILCLLGALLSACANGGNQPQATPTEGGSDPKPSPEATVENVELRMLWWGSQGRHDITTKVIDLFQQKYPHIKVTPEFSGFDGYWDKLSVQVSGGSAPDVIQMSFAYLAEYANRQVLLELSDQGIDFSAIDDGTLSTGTINDQLYAIPAGVNSNALIYNKDLLDKAGIQLSDSLSWDELAEVLIKVRQSLGEDIYGMLDQNGNPDMLNYYVRQQGMSFFKDNQIGFTADVLKDYFDYWEQLREAGGVPSAEKNASLAGIAIEQWPIVIGEGAFEVIPSNSYTNIVNLANKPLEMTFFPTDPNGQNANFLTPSMYWSVYEKSKHPKEAALLLDFLINDPEAGQILGADRGVPVSAKIRELLTPQLNEFDQKQFEYIDAVAKVSTPAEVIEPKGAGEIRQLLMSTGQELQFKRKTTEQAAEEFIRKANDILDKMK